MSESFDVAELKRRMQGALGVLKQELGGLRTGRASASLLDPIVAQAYGSTMPLSQLATVSVPEARMISVQVWDRSTVGAVDKAIRESNLGLNPIVEGQTLRIPIPELNAERRQELVKAAHRYAEGAKVSVRQVRRDGMDQLKRLDKDREISEDDHRKLSEQVQKLTDQLIIDIDQALAAKEAEIIKV